MGYAVRTSGLPLGRTYTVLYSGLSTNWTRVPVATNARPDAAGRLVDLSTTALYREDDDRGESLQIELVADDDSVYAVDKVFPFPIAARDGACHVWAEVMTQARDRFLLWLDGFRAGEQVRIASADACDAQTQLHTIGPDGRLVSGVVH